MSNKILSQDSPFHEKSKQQYQGKLSSYTFEIYYVLQIDYK